MCSLKPASSSLYQRVICTSWCAASTACELSHWAALCSLHALVILIATLGLGFEGTEIWVWGQGCRAPLQLAVYRRHEKEHRITKRERWHGRFKDSQEEVVRGRCYMASKTLCIQRLWRSYSWYFPWYERLTWLHLQEISLQNLFSSYI